MSMSFTNHISMEAPQAWSWKLPSRMPEDDYHRNYYYHYYYSQQQQQQKPDDTAQHLREHLFEKPLTPSDVGKLNRLVIPKQHAERHFPLDGESGEKGLLLSFEDESGKLWRFRYSYWTSSQSYVLTKGWSRFVKEKQLDAGDVVFFERRRSDADRLCIGCKRRGDPVMEIHPTSYAQGVPWTNPASFSTPQCYDPYNTSVSHLFVSSPMQEDFGVRAVERQSRMSEKMATPATTTNSKRLRLFGVNLECEVDKHESPGPTTIHDRNDEFSTTIDPRELQLLT